MPACPRGHESTTADYCDTCGAPMDVPSPAGTWPEPSWVTEQPRSSWSAEPAAPSAASWSQEAAQPAGSSWSQEAARPAWSPNPPPVYPSPPGLPPASPPPAAGPPPGPTRSGWSTEPAPTGWNSEPAQSAAPSWGAEPAQSGWTSEPAQPATSSWTPDPAQSAAPSWGAEPAQPTTSSWTPDPAQSTAPSWGAEPAQSGWTSEPAQPATSSWTPEPAQSTAPSWAPSGSSAGWSATRDDSYPFASDPPAGGLGGYGGHGATRSRTWLLVVTADREYFDRVQAMRGPDSGEIEFPTFAPQRRFPLSDQQVTIGRRSRARGVYPEIDLAGAPEDLGVSHMHAMLVPDQNGGDWAVIDLHSRNRTYVNDGDPIEFDLPITLNAGDHVNLGAWTRITLMTD